MNVAFFVCVAFDTLIDTKLKNTPMKKLTQPIYIIIVCLSAFMFLSSGTPPGDALLVKGEHYYYCEYCGHRFTSVRLLTSATCPRHPDGSNKGRHKLYEGTEKKQYTCKYCGHKFPSIMVMTGGTCVNHPKGSNKGRHAPAL